MKLSKLLLVTTFLLTAASNSFAQFNADMVIEKSRGRKVIFTLGFESVNIGDVLITVDENERKRGVIRVTKVGRNKALATVVKGKALEGWFLEKYKKKQKRRRRARPKPKPLFEEYDKAEEADEYEGLDEPRESSNRDDEEDFSSHDDYESPRKRARSLTKRGKKGYDAGILLSKSSYSLDVDIPVGNSTTTASLEASPITYHAYFRMPYNKAFDIVATAGIENYSAIGEVTDSSCDGSNECITNVNYFSARAMAAYKFHNQDFNPWVGAGVGVMYPSSAESNTVDASTISTTLVVPIGAGLQWIYDRTWSVPAMVNYTYFFGGDGVSTKILAIQAGVAYSF